MSSVTLTFDLWPPKSIGCILSSRLTCLASLTKKYATVWSLWCSQAWLSRKCDYWTDRRTHARTHTQTDAGQSDPYVPPKSIGCILSSRLTCLPSLIKKSTTVKSLLCSQAYFHRCPVWPWPLTSDLQNQ